MTEKEATKILISLLRDKSERKYMQVSESGVLYATDIAVIKIPEAYALLEFLERDLSHLFVSVTEVNEAKPTIYRAVIDKVGMAVKFDVDGAAPVWINKSYYDVLKGAVKRWTTNGRRVYAYDSDEILMAIIAPIIMRDSTEVTE